MDAFIKKIFEERAEGDNLAHIQFQKFGKGIFENRAVILTRKSGDKFSIGTSAEYANEFVRAVAEKLGKGKAAVSGVVVSTRNLKEIPEFSGIFQEGKVKQFAGVKQFAINQELSGERIINLLNASPLAFFALSFSIPSGSTELKIKAKAPKSAKPSTRGDAKPKADFCKIITSDREIAKSVLFDVNLENLKKAEISHDFIITDLILPKGETNPAKMRELAKRKGKIIRKISIDSKTEIKEKEFAA